MKIAISVPDEVFEAGEHLAQQLKLSRSQLYTDALAAYLSEKGAAAVTAKLNAIYGKETSKIGGEYLRAQSKVLVDEAW
jgi:metal-responsive CopG/Arc/MetJ family transcriptional regulator